MKKVDELKIGEEFQLGDRRFVIEEETEGDIEVCVGCFFKDTNLDNYKIGETVEVFIGKTFTDVRCKDEKEEDSEEFPF